MTDIVQWLRAEAELIALPRLHEAADEIERLRAALQSISDLTAFYEPWADIARRALEDKK
jgi:hypothetical protein